MMGRFFWIVVGAAAVFAYLNWDKLTGAYENRKAISAGGRAYAAGEDLINAGKDLYHEVFQ
jgi:hypothetical protein